MDVPMWFLHEVSAFWRKNYTFFSLNACPLEDKSPFLSFLGVTKTNPYSFWTKKVWPDWCPPAVGWRLGAFGFSKTNSNHAFFRLIICGLPQDP